VKKLLLTLALSFLTVTNVFSAPATMYVTVAGAGDKGGSTWANAMGYAEWETDCETLVEAGDIYYVAGGTYTLTSDMACYFAPGTSALPIQVIGVASGTSNEPPVFSDWAYGTDRPLIAGGAYNFGWDDYITIKNLRATTTDTSCIFVDYNGFIYNTKVENTSGTAGRSGFSTDDNSIFLNVEASSTNGNAMNVSYAYRTAILYSYLHDSSTCIYGEVLNGGTILGNVIDTCSTQGIYADTNDKIINNTFYNCTQGVDGATSGQITVLNNIFDNNTTGMVMDSSVPASIVDYNVWSNNGTDVTNVTKGSHAVTEDITLTDPSNGDFTLPDSSGAEGAGAQVNTNIGVTGDYNWNIGVDQTDTQSGGGATSYGFAN